MSGTAHQHMKAWLLESFNGLDALKLADIPRPVPQPGEALIHVDYAALNPADRYLSEAQYPARPPMPHILGRDGIGTIVEIHHTPESSHLSRLSVGQKVVILRSEIGVNRPGLFAEYSSVPLESLVVVPDGWTDTQAAAAPLVYLTAYQALTQFGDLPDPATILITGASGGVGVASVQIARAMNPQHTIIALSRSAEKSAILKSLGADVTIDPMQNAWAKDLRKQLGQTRVDLAIDNIGGEAFSHVIDCLGMNGRVSCIGRLAGPVPNFNTASLFFRRIQIRGVAVATYTASESQNAWMTIVTMLARTGARPQVDNVFEFSGLRAAFEKLARGPMGKVLLKVH